MTFTLCDGTEQMNSRFESYWDVLSTVADVDSHKYVMVHGMVRWSPGIYFDVRGLRLVLSGDEFSYHTSEAAVAAAAARAGRRTAAAARTRPALAAAGGTRGARPRVF